MRRIRISSYVLLLVISMVLVSCGGAGKKESVPAVQYFRHLQFSEGPHDIPKGTYPLTAEEAKTINHFRLNYNEQGKLASISYMRGETILGYSPEGFAVTEFTYTDSSQTQQFFDKDHQLVENDGVYSFVYKLDKDGNRIGLSFLDKNGNKVANRNNIAWYEWRLLPDSMIQEKRYNPEGIETIMNPFCPFFELRFSYDKNGYVTRMANYMADTLYNCTAENCGDIGVSYFEFVNNDKGNIQQFSVHNASGRSSNLYWGWSKFINTLDEKGYTTETAFWDQDNEYVGGRNTPINTYAYDEHGAVIERKHLDKNRKLVMSTMDSAALIKYTYTETGLPKDTLRFNEKMAAIVKK